MMFRQKNEELNIRKKIKMQTIFFFKELNIRKMKIKNLNNRKRSLSKENKELNKIELKMKK